MGEAGRKKTLPGRGGGSLGTFGGVFTPSILTILGIILFMRLGYVVGSAGLQRALVIIALANLISVLTTFSLSAVATNLRVKGGGDYYLISRTLGVEFGGAIGLVLFLAQSVSVAFYCIGFGEAVAAMIHDPPAWLPQAVAAAAALFLFAFAWLGADWATRFQYVVMAALAAALASFFIGGLAEWDGALLARNWADGGGTAPFWILFAIFFPAVTGFTQGVSMSGDLKDPGRSLPLGTFLAVGLSILVYFGAAVVFAAGMPAAELSGDYGAMSRLALFGWLIQAGVVAATLSSAMASFLGAPRILQSMARDRIFPVLVPFTAGAGPLENPRRGVLLTAGIALATIALGRLNVIAPVVSMFFLISYGLLNYATYYEARAASPSFRPRFRWFDQRLSLLGALGCLGAMMAINLPAGIAAVSVLAAVHQYLKRTAGPARWADSRRSFHFQRLREHLFAMAGEDEHPRDWRPRLLVFSKDTERRERLLRFSSWLEGGSGLTTAVQILEGEGARMRKVREEADAALARHIKELGLEAFHLTVTAPTLRTGARILIQSYGLGPVHANTIVLNWLDEMPDPEDASEEKRYGRHLRAAIRLGCNVVVLDSKEDEWAAVRDVPAGERRIDVWWWNDATSRLMLLLAYLVTRSEDWEGAHIRVLAGMESCSGKDDLEEEAAARDAAENTASGDGGIESLRRMLSEARIEAEPVVVDAVTADVMVELSRDAALVFCPLRLRDNQPADPFGERLEDLFARLPIVAVVLAAEDIPLDAEPEEGKAGETAAILDTASDLRKKAADAETEAERAAALVTKAQRQLADAAADLDPEKRRTLESELAELEELALKASRRAAKAKVKAEDALRAAAELDAKEGKTGGDAGTPEKG